MGDNMKRNLCINILLIFNLLLINSLYSNDDEVYIKIDADRIY